MRVPGGRDDPDDPRSRGVPGSAGDAGKAGKESWSMKHRVTVEVETKKHLIM